MINILMFQEVRLPNKGRALVATQDIAEGTLLLVADPECAVLCDYETTCFFCFSERAEGLPWQRRCKECGVARFCSEVCKESATAVHSKVECDAFKNVLRLRNTFDDDLDDVLTLCSLIIARERSPVEWDALCWRENVDPAFVDRIARAASEVLQRDDISRVYAEKLLGQDELNCFGIDAPMPDGELGADGEPDVNYVGKALYLKASSFNHSCLPNVVRVRQGRRFYFITRDAVKAGQELCISYMNSLRHKDREARMAMLFEHYGFHCDCPLCSGAVAEANRKMCRRCGTSESLDNEKYCCVCDAEQLIQKHYYQ